MIGIIKISQVIFPPLLDFHHDFITKNMNNEIAFAEILTLNKWSIFCVISDYYRPPACRHQLSPVHHITYSLCSELELNGCCCQFETLV